jgi:hypothetical protein
MAKFWREKADPKKHCDFMSTRNEGGLPVQSSEHKLVTKWVYLIEVDGFTFQFISLEQAIECKAYFSSKTHPSTREAGHVWEHYWHPWYCKLPKGMTRTAKRKKLIKTIDSLLNRYAGSLMMRRPPGNQTEKSMTHDPA